MYHPEIVLTPGKDTRYTGKDSADSAGKEFELSPTQDVSHPGEIHIFPFPPILVDHKQPKHQLAHQHL